MMTLLDRINSLIGPRAPLTLQVAIKMAVINIGDMPAGCCPCNLGIFGIISKRGHKCYLSSTYLEIADKLLGNIGAHRFARVEGVLLGDCPIKSNSNPWSGQFHFELFMLVIFGQIAKFEITFKWRCRWSSTKRYSEMISKSKLVDW